MLSFHQNGFQLELALKNVKNANIDIGSTSSDTSPEVNDLTQYRSGFVKKLEKKSPKGGFVFWWINKK